MMEKTEILVLASHSDTLIESMCDKAALMHHGRLLEFGPVESIQRSYQRIVAAG
jgi:ABC-2 type transport system ATP-binding protein/lipopolysaccharide transport system ATP-binding protein